MAKALSLDVGDEEFKAPDAPKAAGTVVQGPLVKRQAPKPSKANYMPLQVRWPPGEVKAIKRSALDADQSVSEFLLACYHVAKKS